ncbi:MAG TPA: hypothetical protein VIL52_01005, partial [Bacteroidota bacterium]
ALVSLQVPPSLRGLFAEKQVGYYVQVNVPFGAGIVEAWQRSVFTASVRFDAVDFDRDILGDDRTRLTLGINFRPVFDTVIKFNYEQNWMYDRENNLARAVGFIIAMASYF